MTINWKDYVDQIYCVHYVEQKNRIPLLYDQLKRVDILDSGIYYQFDNIKTPFYADLYNHFSPLNTLTLKYNYAFDTTMAHYYCIKHALANNYKNILIIENDICFLKDKQEIVNILDGILNHDLKNEWNNRPSIILGNTSFKYCYNNKIYCNWDPNYDQSFDTIAIYFNLDDFGYDRLALAGFNIYNELAMKALVDKLENYEYAVIDNYYSLYKDKNCLVAPTMKHICLQREWIFQGVSKYDDYYIAPPSKEEMDNIAMDDTIYNCLIDNFSLPYSKRIITNN